jgi:Flp pilus assembly protein TadG
MRCQNQSRRRRSGATIVEAALVLALFLMFLFGLFEYTRYLLVHQLLANAARDGVRYASTNVDKSNSFLTVDEGGKTNITTYVRGECKSADTWIDGFAVNVWPCDNTQLMNMTTPVIQAKSGYTSWNQATFTERLALEITGTYRPVLPVVWLPNGGGLKVGFYGSGNSVPVRIVAVSNPES